MMLWDWKVVSQTCTKYKYSRLRPLQIHSGPTHTILLRRSCKGSQVRRLLFKPCQHDDAAAVPLQSPYKHDPSFSTQERHNLDLALCSICPSVVVKLANCQKRHAAKPQQNSSKKPKAEVKGVYICQALVLGPYTNLYRYSQGQQAVELSPRPKLTPAI